MTIPTKGEARRREILDDARRALLANGYANLSVRDVSKRVGISVGNLQYYYPTKDDLVAAIIHQEITDSLNLLNDLTWTSDHAESSVTEAIARTMKYLAGPAGTLYLVSGTLALSEPKFQAQHERGYTYALTVLANKIHLIAPDLTESACERLASMSMALIDGAVLRLQGMESSKQPAELEQLTRDLSASIITLMQVG